MEVSRITASHIEDYLVYLGERPRWFGKRGRQKTPMSDSPVAPILGLTELVGLTLISQKARGIFSPIHSLSAR